MSRNAWGVAGVIIAAAVGIMTIIGVPALSELQTRKDSEKQHDALKAEVIGRDESAHQRIYELIKGQQDELRTQREASDRKMDMVNDRVWAILKEIRK